MNCNCSEKYQCVHEAALYLYLENHKELLKSEDKNIKDIDKNFYLKKLSNIFSHGKEKDFELHGFYNFDLIASDLENFLNNDVANIINAKDYEFASELLCKIGDVLIKDVYLSFHSWYNVAQEFMSFCDPLTFSFYISDENLDKLISFEDYISNFITMW